MDAGYRTPGFLEARYAEIERHEFAGATLTLFDLKERPDGPATGTPQEAPSGGSEEGGGAETPSSDADPESTAGV
jgi:hypothetical protein